MTADLLLAVAALLRAHARRVAPRADGSPGPGEVDANPVTSLGELLKRQAALADQLQATRDVAKRRAVAEGAAPALQAPPDTQAPPEPGMPAMPPPRTVQPPAPQPAAPAGPSVAGLEGVNKCVVDGQVTYTNAACPPGATPEPPNVAQTDVTGTHAPAAPGPDGDPGAVQVPRPAAFSASGDDPSQRTSMCGYWLAEIERLDFEFQQPLPPPVLDQISTHLGNLREQFAQAKCGPPPKPRPPGRRAWWKNAAAIELAARARCRPGPLFLQTMRLTMRSARWLRRAAKAARFTKRLRALPCQPGAHAMLWGDGLCGTAPTGCRVGGAHLLFKK